MDKTFFMEEVVGDRYSRDPDSAGKSREFYASFWGGVLSPNFEDYSTAGKAKYRGDTTISFNTVSGSVLRLLMLEKVPAGSQARLEMILASDLIDDGLKRQFANFQKLYHSLANFMPLPDAKWNRNTNMNAAKGASPLYHDFPDLFYQAVHDQVFVDDDTAEKMEPVFLTTNNQTYFDKFGGSCRNFVEVNFLQDFFVDEEYSQFKRLAPTEYDVVLYRNRKLVTDDMRRSGFEYASFF